MTGGRAGVPRNAVHGGEQRAIDARGIELVEHPRHVILRRLFITEATQSTSRRTVGRQRAVRVAARANAPQGIEEDDADLVEIRDARVVENSENVLQRCA